MTSSNVIKLREILDSGATRASAEQVRSMVLSMLQEAEVITVDFKAFRITPSFADELMGKLASRLGTDKFRRRVRAENLDDATRILLRHAVRRRLGERLRA